PHHHPHHPTVGVNVNTNVNVTVQTSATAAANANANASLRSSTQNFFGGGGGGGGLVAPAAGYIPGLAVQAGEVNSSYEATRTLYKKVVIQAFCFDDKLSPHPASQVTPDRDIDSAYDGELYRCIAGAHMQVTIADWKQNISFEGGRTLTCQKGEALYHGPGPQGGTLQCRPQRPARDCNERSLLRRFGAGIKVLTMLITEKYTATRQESTTSSAGTALSLDGGVGGVAY
ncbi:MAG TPA: hypothetical protein VFC47_00785, partial [Caulobacteraceae bacterium]|nr:hypothetical protein [Caulobacteraceae bacterium]